MVLEVRYEVIPFWGWYLIFETYQRKKEMSSKWPFSFKWSTKLEPENIQDTVWVHLLIQMFNYSLYYYFTCRIVDLKQNPKDF